MAARPAARRRGNVDDRPSRERRHQSCTRHQFRSADLAKWNCRVGRPVVERSFGGIFAVVHSARGRGQRTQRSLAGRDRTVNMASQSTQFALASRILHWLMAAMLLPMLFIGVTLVAHVGAVLFHTLIVRDRLLHRMALWSIRSDSTTARPD